MTIKHIIGLLMFLVFLFLLFTLLNIAWASFENSDYSCRSSVELVARNVPGSALNCQTRYISIDSANAFNRKASDAMLSCYTMMGAGRHAQIIQGNFWRIGPPDISLIPPWLQINAWRGRLQTQRMSGCFPCFVISADRDVTYDLQAFATYLQNEGPSSGSATYDETLYGHDNSDTDAIEAMYTYLENTGSFEIETPEAQQTDQSNAAVVVIYVEKDEKNAVILSTFQHMEDENLCARSIITT